MLRLAWGPLALLVGAVPFSVLGADKPAVGPLPSWVHSKPIPQVAADHSNAPVRVILDDEQVDFSGSTTSIYQENAVQITSPAGLSKMGTITLTWQPATDVITVNRLRILRAGKPIEVPHAATDFTILRRENGLEYSMLNGVLTATLQLEGLQVGDVVDIAYTLERTLPLFNGHHDLLLDVGSATQLQSLNVDAHWTADDAMAHRAINLPVSLSSGKTGLSLSAANVEPPVLPQGAPIRFRMGRIIELSDYNNWGQVSAVFAPLFDKARALSPDSPLKSEIAQIRSSSRDPLEQASMALALVESKVRYLYIGLNQSDYVPATADETWKRRFGDCKAKAALLLALLDGLGISAEPALVSTVLGDGLNERLPNIGQFNHVIVRAEVGGKTYWLDGTRQGDTNIAHLEVPDYHWALPIHGTNNLEALVVPPRSIPSEVVDLHLDASKGIFVPALAQATNTFHGDSAVGLEKILAAVPASQLNSALRAYWLKSFDFITPEKVNESFDPAGPTLTLTMVGTAKMDWNTNRSEPYYELDNTRLGFTPNYHRDPGPDQDAPFALDYPDYTLNRETVTLPGGGSEFAIGDNDLQLEKTLAEREFKRTVNQQGNVVTVEAYMRPLKPELPYQEAIAVAPKLTALYDIGAYINVSSNYAWTQDDAETILAEENDKSSDTFIKRVNALLYLKKPPEMLAEAQRFVAAFPQLPMAYATRGLAYIANHDRGLALADADKAQKLDPDGQSGSWIKGYFKTQDEGSTAAFGSEVIWPDLLATRFSSQASDCFRNQDYGCALEFAGYAIAREPNSSDSYLTRANVYMRRQEPSNAAAQADLMLKAAPTDSNMQAVAGTIYCSTNECDKGMKALARSIEIRPNITAYLNRARFRPKSDIAGRRQDIEAAYKLAPDDPAVLTAFADFYRQTGDHSDEVKMLESQQAASGSGFDTDLKARLAQAYVAAGMADKASELYSEIRGYSAGTGKADDYNALCYSEAAANFDLTTALADCKQAIARAPDDAAILDSLGFVQLRLKQYPAAVATYDKALAKQSGLSDSLYGRGLAYFAMGNTKAAANDFAAAKKANPLVVETFLNMGISPPQTIETNN